MIDTHCHIFLDEFEQDLKEVLDRAAENGVEKIFMPAIDLNSIHQMNTIHHDSIELYKMAGVHPCEVDGERVNLEKKLFEVASSDEIVGIGETGLDYYWSTDYVNEQKKNLRIHCNVSRELNKPIILHNRESTEDILRVIEEEQDGHLRGIWHCFNGTVEEGKRAIDLGLYLGIGGVTTFKNAGVDKTVAELPLDYMVLETDAPYLAPTPNRGKRNEPAFIRFTAEKLAMIKDVELSEIDEITTKNALEIFQLVTA